MIQVLTDKLWAYIIHNNPELVLSLQENFSITDFLQRKVKEVLPLAERLLDENRPHYVIEELCLNEMTTELRPSKFQYIRAVLEEEYPEDYKRLREDGLITYEVVNMVEACREIFEAFDFSQENQDNRHLRHAVIGQIHDYLP